MFLIDKPSLLIFLLTLVSTLLFYWHSKKVMEKFESLKNAGFNDNNSSASYTELRAVHESVSEFVFFWRIALFVLVISVTGVLYFSYMSKIQLVNQLEELNN